MYPFSTSSSLPPTNHPSPCSSACAFFFNEHLYGTKPNPEQNAHILVYTRNGARHSGFLDSVDPDFTAFTLRAYRDLAAPPSVPEKDSMRFPATQLMGWQRSGPEPQGQGQNGAPKG